jgi:hypothetical protein
MSAHGIQQITGACHIAGPKKLRVGRAVRQHSRAMDHAVNSFGVENPLQLGGIAKVHLLFPQVSMTVFVGTEIHTDRTDSIREQARFEYPPKETGASGYKYSPHF